MIDTIFFLLVFFMIAWLSMVRMNGLALSLPRENDTAGKPPVSITLSVSTSGAYYINTNPIAESAWQARLATMLTKHRAGGEVVVLNVAPEQKTQTLVSLIDTVNRTIVETHANAQVLVATPKVKAIAAPDSGENNGPR